VGWNAVSGAASYKVYYATSANGAYTLAGTVAEISYTHTGLSQNTTYYYKVAAVNSAGESEQSSYTSATTPNAVPSTPAGVAASAQSSSSILVSWNAVSGAAGYKVYYATSADGAYALAGTAATASYTHTGLSQNTTYYYKVSAVNSAGESEQSSPVYTTTPNTVPSEPTGVAASAQSSSSILVSWNAVSGAASYKVYYATSSYGAYALAGTASTTSYTHTGLLSDTTYYYKVSAVNSAGESDQSYYSASDRTPLAKPSTPTGVTASALSSSSILVGWNAVPGATSYKVYYAANASGPYQLDGTAYTNSFTSTGWDPFMGAYFKVTAINSAGESDQSSYVFAFTDP
jgi:fibronectin type 3 domain-containing protein